MIFQHTIANVLNRSKSQTRRLCYAKDRLIERAPGERGVWEPVGQRFRWIVGHTYAVQPERCHTSRGRIRITDLRREENPLLISEADAIAEGFESAAAFREAWESLHKKQPIQPVWVISFELVTPASSAIPAGKSADLSTDSSQTRCITSGGDR